MQSRDNTTHTYQSPTHAQCMHTGITSNYMESADELIKLVILILYSMCVSPIAGQSGSTGVGQEVAHELVRG